MYILIGAHGVGKTTLLNAIREKHPQFYVTDGFSRPVKKVKDKLGLNKEQEQEIINELTLWAFQNYITSDIVISGRSPIDAIIYTNVYCPRLSISNILETFLKLKDKIKGVFYIPIEFPLVDDGVRFSNQGDQILIDKLILDFLNTHQIQYVQLTGSVEERLNQIEKYLIG
jgi:nicotinamide riboside kinase